MVNERDKFLITSVAAVTSLVKNSSVTSSIFNARTPKRAVTVFSSVCSRLESCVSNLRDLASFESWRLISLLRVVNHWSS